MLSTGRFTILDYSVCGAYFLLIALVNVARLRFRNRTEEDYFVGGRHMNWVAVGISMFATGFSSVSFLGLPQRGAYQDFSYYLTILLIPILIAPVLCIWFVPLFVGLRLSSGYEYLRMRFGVVVQRVGSLLYCCYAIGSMGAMLYAVSLTMREVLGLTPAQYYMMLVGLGLFTTVYTAAGGLGAVVWTDVFQSATLGLAALVVLFLAVNGIAGGLGGLWSIGSQHAKFTMIHPELLSPTLESLRSPRSPYTAVAFAVFMYLPGYAVSQNMILRYVCAGDVSRARRVVVLSALVNVGMGCLLLLLGVAFFVFYCQPGGPGMPKLHSEDQILPYFITQASVPGLTGLVVAGMFAAASAMDSGINGVASVLCFDWLGGRRLPVRKSQMLTVVLGGVVILSALAAPVLGSSLIDIVNAIAGTMLGGLLAIFLLGMFTRRANTPGVLVGLTAGVVCLLAVIVTSDVPRWWYGGFIIGPTLLVGWLASHWFEAPSAESLSVTLKSLRKSART